MRHDDLDAARGIVYAVLGSLVLWLILAGVIAFIWHATCH